MALLERQAEQGYTPLHVACQNGHQAMVEAALAGLSEEKKMALLERQAEQGYTPLHLACLDGHQAVVEAVLAGLNEDHQRRLLAAKITSGRTLAQLAQHRQHPDLFAFLTTLSRTLAGETPAK